MTSRHQGAGSIRGDVLRLFEGESLVGLGDGDLLTRFVNDNDQAAFEGLVSRLGPMVLGVLRRTLGNSDEVDDAFQATFLVLVRRAGSIRDRDLVAPWLHGVATRVARRARAVANRRRDRERKARVGAEAWELPPDVDRSEVRSRIDEEIERLPDSHRKLIVLCDVEGLSREEAAARLGWTLNMVRGRLDRARTRLRDRLTRRGLSPSGAYLALAGPAAMPRPSLVAATVQGALAMARGVVVASMSASAVSLSEGVARMMVFAKWKLVAAALISTSVVAAGAGMIAAQEPGQDLANPVQKQAVFPASNKAAEDYADLLDKLEAIGNKGLSPEAKATHADAVRQWSVLFENDLNNFQGNDRIDPIADASKSWMDEAVAVAETREAARDAVRDHVTRLERLVKKVEVWSTPEAKGPLAARGKERLKDAKDLLALAERKAGGAIPADDPLSPEASDPVKPRSSAELARARIEAALKRYSVQKGFYDEGRITIDRLIAASQALMDAQRDATGSKVERVLAVRSHYARVKEILRREQAELEVGRATTADTAEASNALLEAEFLLAKETEEVGTGRDRRPSTSSSSGAALPGTEDAAPKPPTASTPTPGATPLSTAVQVFNTRLKTYGGLEPDLTEAEVVAAIRYWRDKQDEFSFDMRVGPTDAPKPDTPEAVLKKIDATRQLPEGAAFEIRRSEDVGYHTYEGWWISLGLLVQNRTTVFRLSIRERLVRSITLEEALAREEKTLLDHANDEPYLRSAIEDRINRWERRIKARDRDAGVKPQP